tara:strand:- start:82 stop:561 length:480 start_codon:yes stop_codon:yes gene_type:complete
MQEKNQNKTAQMMDVRHDFAIIGLFIALFALALSVSTPWILDHFAPPAPTIEDVAIEKAVGIKDKLILALKGEEYKDSAPKIEITHWTDYWSLIVILIAFGGVFNGSLGMIRAETRIVGGTAIFIGMAAIIAQYAWIALGVLVLTLLVIGILSAMGVSF